MKLAGLVVIGLFGSISATAGWVGHRATTSAGCAYTVGGYDQLNGDVLRLPSYSIEQVPNEVVGAIQVCWAANPYGGPQHSIQLVDARKMPSGGYYILFRPLGITDIQLVFQVERTGRVVRAFRYSTFSQPDERPLSTHSRHSADAPLAVIRKSRIIIRMNDDLEWRRNWRTNWLSSIQEFADEETQRRLWLDTANTNPHFSFVEYLCCYFDDLRLSDSGYQWAIKQRFVSEQEAVAVAAFHKIADAYNSPTDDYDHQAILADPKWKDVVAAAKQAQAELLRLLRDTHERRLLMEP